MASPEAASVVERLCKLAAEDPGWDVSVNPDDLRALLAVVEAAKDVRIQQEGVGSEVWDVAIVPKAAMYRMLEALEALYAPDSAEPRDAEGAKP